MPITTPVPIDSAPTVPSRSGDQAAFDTAYEAFYDWEKTDLQPGINAMAQACFDNAESAHADALATAADRVQTGEDRFQTGLDKYATAENLATTTADRIAAAASAVEASKLNLGAKASAPSVDNQGAALLTGAIYYDTTLAKWRVWTGSAWADGVSSIAGVSTVDGLSGAVTLKTVGGQALTGSGNVTTVLSDVQTFTASGTWTKPAYATWVLVEEWGGGGSGGMYSSVGAGGGGGGAYGSRLMRASDVTATVTVTVGAGGAATTTNNTDGNDGGTSSFGAYITAAGGKKGLTAGVGGDGGAGTKSESVGISPPPLLTGYADGAGGWGNTSYNGPGGNSSIGGAGGGGSGLAGSYPAGTSLRGGNGGAGSATSGAAGSPRGGGGGGARSGTSGAGGRGEVVVYTW